MDNFEIYSFLKSKGGSRNALVNTSDYDSPVFKVGDTITIVGSATGGTAPYTYAFYIKRGTATNWSSREPDQGDNVINLRPTSATSYQVKIDVTDWSKLTLRIPKVLLQARFCRSVWCLRRQHQT